MTLVSIIIPSGRDPERTQSIVNRLYGSCLYDLEVIVTSPGFLVAGAINIKDEMVGSSRSIAEAYQYTKGDYIGWLSDICFPTGGCITNIIDFLEANKDIGIAEFRTSPPVTEGHYRICTINGMQYARWGMMSRGTIEQVGFFDPVYVSHYGDVDLSMRCWDAGLSVKTCVDAIIKIKGHHHLKDEVTLKQGETIFLAKWSHRFLNLRPDNTAEWNIDMEIPL